MSFEYFACSGCKKEFFSEAEFRAHPCMVSHMDASGNLSKVVTSGKLSQAQIVPGITRAKLETAQDDNKTEMEKSMQMAIDKRLDESKALIAMKSELVANGIQCQTMSEEQTKEAYEKLKARQNAENEAAQPEDDAPKRRRAKKTAETN